ncbi:minor head protein [Bacillus phage BCASJ1c]|uniref:37 n=1 Tax=Bacillus phage BCASJ1c TaxID=294382 RepID=Q5YA73_9CAUD|nr:minor head protein [Bacillus phage BCASJ1c]AAU85084.1 37 [Bacillus phage BCASJ1c]
MEPRKPRVTPHQLDMWSANMAELYNSLEGEIIRIIINRLKDGPGDIAEWQAQKLAELRLFNSEVVKQLAKVTPVAEKEIQRMLEEAGKEIIQDVDRAMPYAYKPMPTTLDRVMESYHRQIWLDIDNYVNQTLITTHYGAGTAQIAYQNTLNKTAAMFNTGLYSLEDAVEKSVRDLAQKGINSTFIDKGGHTWSLERYTRTVMKSTLGNTYDKLRKDRMEEYGVHTVLVTSHVGARDACSIIQGNVVDLRSVEDLPEDSEYKSIYDPDWQADYEAPGGHRGVNCDHLHIPFIPGVNTNNQPKIDMKLNAQVAQAKDRQRQIEREIVRYKKNLMVAEHMESEHTGYWRSMVRKRQEAMREHIDNNEKYLSRNYRREKVYTPLDTLLEDFTFDKGA